MFSQLQVSAFRAGAGAAAATESAALLPQWVACHWRFARRGGWGVSPPQGVILHATNAADKLLMLTTLRLFDYDAKRAMLNDTFHHAAFVQVGARA